MPSSESAAPLSRARGSAATQSSSFQSELRDDTDPPNVQATAAIIDDQATTAGHRRRPHISDKAKGDGRTDPQKADSDMTTMTIMFTMLAAYFYLLNEKTSREHGAFDTLDSCHSGASTAHDLCHQIWDSQPRPRLNTIPKKGQVNTATAEDAFFSAEEKRSAEMHAMIAKLAAFFVDEKSSSHKHGATAHGADRSHGHGATKSGAGWPRPGAATRSNNTNNVKRYPVPDGFPSGICYKYCIGVCHREHCNRKHEKTDEAMKLIRDAATTKEN